MSHFAPFFMADRILTPTLEQFARINLRTYSAELHLGSLTVGLDNIHYDVSLSQKFVEFTRAYLQDYIRQAMNLAQFTAMGSRHTRAPEASAFRKLLTDLMQTSLTRAKYEKNIEIDLLFRVSLLKFLTQEIAAQFANLLLEAKEWIRMRGQAFEHSEQGHILKARIAELQTGRRDLYRQLGQHIFQILSEIEDNTVAKARRALFGDEAVDSYDMLKNRLVFVEGGKDDVLFLEHYVLLGNYQRDPDRIENIDAMLLGLLREAVLTGGPGEDMSCAVRAHQDLVDAAVAARAELAGIEEERETLVRRIGRSDDLLARVGLRSEPGAARASLPAVERRASQLRRTLEELGPALGAAKSKAEFLTEQYQGHLGDYLNYPENARRLFDPQFFLSDSGGSPEIRSQLLDEWIRQIEQHELLIHVLASYEVRNIYLDFCPPVHLQQLRKALVNRDELQRVAEILKQFPARNYSLKKIEEMAKKLRRYPPEEARTLAARFAEDFMRLRRDMRNYQRLAAAMERLNLIRADKARDLSRMNRSLYEYLLSEEAKPVEDHVATHTVIKADVRGSTKMTQDLLARGLNPASHFSLNLYEPVTRILECYGAAKVFIEGDAMVLAIFEHESNRAQQRAVAKACLLAREMLAVAKAYNSKAQAGDLPPLELGIGIAFQGSAPTYWIDGNSKIMISRALNLSDRLSSCSKVAKRLLAQATSPFRLFLFQTVMAGTSEEEADEFLIRYNLNGIELNEEGFGKLSAEIALSQIEADCALPWGRERVTFYFGEVPMGDKVEPILIRKGFVRQLLSDGKIGSPGTHAYYEVCTATDLIESVRERLAEISRKD
jgi:class 3 adenylate cyclase